jgi:hypothetical protein
MVLILPTRESQAGPLEWSRNGQPDESDTSGKAGGLTVTPSKGATHQEPPKVAERIGHMDPQCSHARYTGVPLSVMAKMPRLSLCTVVACALLSLLAVGRGGALPELSNFGSPPAEPGVYLDQLALLPAAPGAVSPIGHTQFLTYRATVTPLNCNRLQGFRHFRRFHRRLRHLPGHALARRKRHSTDQHG